MERHGERIRKLRKAKGWTQVDLADTAKVDQSTLSGIEKHNAMPYGDTLVKIATALDTTAEYLMAGSTKAWPFRIDIARYSRLNGVQKAYVEARLEAAIESREELSVQEAANPGSQELLPESSTDKNPSPAKKKLASQQWGSGSTSGSRRPGKVSKSGSRGGSGGAA